MSNSFQMASTRRKSFFRGTGHLFSMSTRSLERVVSHYDTLAGHGIGFQAGARHATFRTEGLARSGQASGDWRAAHDAQQNEHILSAVCPKGVEKATAPFLQGKIYNGAICPGAEKG